MLLPPPASRKSLPGPPTMGRHSTGFPWRFTGASLALRWRFTGALLASCTKLPQIVVVSIWKAGAFGDVVVAPRHHRDRRAPASTARPLRTSRDPPIRHAFKRAEDRSDRTAKRRPLPWTPFRLAETSLNPLHFCCATMLSTLPQSVCDEGWQAWEAQRMQREDLNRLKETRRRHAAMPPRAKGKAKARGKADAGRAGRDSTVGNMAALFVRGGGPHLAAAVDAGDIRVGWQLPPSTVPPRPEPGVWQPPVPDGALVVRAHPLHAPVCVTAAEPEGYYFRLDGWPSPPHEPEEAGLLQEMVAEDELSATLREPPDARPRRRARTAPSVDETEAILEQLAAEDAAQAEERLAAEAEAELQEAEVEAELQEGDDDSDDEAMAAAQIGEEESGDEGSEGSESEQMEVEQMEGGQEEGGGNDTCPAQVEPGSVFPEDKPPDDAIGQLRLREGSTPCDMPPVAAQADSAPSVLEDPLDPRITA